MKLRIGSHSLKFVKFYYYRPNILSSHRNFQVTQRILHSFLSLTDQIFISQPSRNLVIFSIKTQAACLLKNQNLKPEVTSQHKRGARSSVIPIGGLLSGHQAWQELHSCTTMISHQRTKTFKWAKHPICT